MTAPRVSQLALVSPVAQPPPPMRVSQLALVTVLVQAPPPIRISQLAIVSVVQNNREFVALQNVISLPCWQPCTAFGFEGRIITHD
jgi:hypothetical protein